MKVTLLILAATMLGIPIAQRDTGTVRVLVHLEGEAVVPGARIPSKVP